MKITKGNQIKEVSAKSGAIAISKFGWSEYAEPKRPSEIGTRTRRIEPPVITSDQPIKLKEAVYPGDEIIPEPVLKNQKDEVITGKDEVPGAAPVKKTRKLPVKSKSVKK